MGVVLSKGEMRQIFGKKQFKRDVFIEFQDFLLVFTEKTPFKQERKINGGGHQSSSSSWTSGAPANSSSRTF